MPYVLERSLGDFPNIPEWKALIQEAVAAANSGDQFNQTVDATVEGAELRVYARVHYENDLPTSVEIGQDHSNIAGLEELRSALGFTVNTQEPWATVMLVKDE